MRIKADLGISKSALVKDLSATTDFYRNIKKHSKSTIVMVRN